MAKRNVCVRDRRAHTTLYSSNKNKWAQTLEHRERKVFITAEEMRGKRKEDGEKKKIERGVCAYFGVHLEVLDLHVCQHISALPVPKHVCPMKGERLSCLYFPQKSAMMSPWTHLEPTSVKKHYSSPPSRRLIFCSTSPFFTLHSCLSNSSPSSHSSFLFFHISVFFNISSLSSMSLSLSESHLFWQARPNWITKRAAVCQKCQDVLIIINFV